MSFAMREVSKKALLPAALTLALACGMTLLAQNSAQSDNPEIRLAPGEIKWPAGSGPAAGTSFVAGIQTVVVKGDPTKAGLYTLMLRLGPNIKIQAHSHRDNRVATVISGKWYFGYGKQFDEKALKELPAGSFYTEPPGVAHFAETKDVGATITISGTGPTDTVYVDPRNDPTKQQPPK
jgi:quercetin dioxygenase-like cupin family protein